MVSWADVTNWFANNWWIWVILLGLIGFWIWNKLDIYTRNKITTTMKGKWIYVVLIGGWWLWGKYGKFSEVSDANRWMPIIFLLYLTAVNYIGKLKDDTPNRLLTPNFHGSYSRNPHEKNGFYIFAIDSFNAGGIAWDYAGRIAVIRKETIELFMHGALSIAEMSPVSRYELDDDVRKFIEKNKFLKGASENVYYGWFDNINKVDWSFKRLSELENSKKENPNTIYNMLKKELGVKNPSVETLYWMYRNQCKATGKQTEILDGTVEVVEKGVEHHKRVKDAYVDKQDKQPRYEGGEENY